MTGNSPSGGTGLLGVIIGAAIVVGIAFFFMGGGFGIRPGDSNIMAGTVPAPAAAAPRQ